MVKEKMRRVRGKRAIYGENEIISDNRKLLPIGDSIGITFPRSWLDRHGLKPGDRVHVVANGVLTVVPVK